MIKFENGSVYPRKIDKISILCRQNSKILLISN